MKMIFEGMGGDGSHCGLSDLYDDRMAALLAALATNDPFDTQWYASKKEIASARIHSDETTLTVEVSCSDDFDTNGHGIVTIPRPTTFEPIEQAIDEAWNAAEEDKDNNAGYLGYSVNNKDGQWVETFLVCIDGSDRPSGDNYFYWGWQNDYRPGADGEGSKCVCGIPAKDVQAFEEFAYSGAVGELKIGDWSMKSWHDKTPDIEDPNDYRGMGWVGSDGRP